MEIPALIVDAIREDIGSGDITTSAVIPSSLKAEGRLEAKTDGVICGLEVAHQVFAAIDPALVWEARADDGDAVETGAVVATVSGNARAVLQAERIALNIVGRLSGIATLTRRFVDRIRGTRAAILDTRKTTPGWRALEKYAVTKGGGQNHRHGLYDRYLVKSNHIDLCESLAEALPRVAANRREDCLLEVEARDLEEASQAASFGVAIIMLDNFPLADVRQAVAAVAGRAKIEVSGGITLENVRGYAEAGVEGISIGALTHSAPALDIRLGIYPAE
ncbi:MAG: carboxylating nicotinate-nucleotide diphosphorylase [Deltaproteobacteria bacterium]|nr:carboxylating nicotinate-nucleotide diphosphorylase [Deltaproteobacteria bacterium]